MFPLNRGKIIGPNKEPCINKNLKVDNSEYIPTQLPQSDAILGRFNKN